MPNKQKNTDFNQESKRKLLHKIFLEYKFLVFQKFYLIIIPKILLSIHDITCKNLWGYDNPNGRKYFVCMESMQEKG